MLSLAGPAVAQVKSEDDPYSQFTRRSISSPIKTKCPLHGEMTISLATDRKTGAVTPALTILLRDLHAPGSVIDVGLKDIGELQRIDQSSGYPSCDRYGLCFEDVAVTYAISPDVLRAASVGAGMDVRIRTTDPARCQIEPIHVGSFSLRDLLATQAP
jgi:hypothetical protein